MDNPDSSPSLRIATWNLEWSGERSWRTPHQLHRLQSVAPDVAVLTEARLPVVRQIFAHTVDAGPHPLSNVPNGSKVVIASRHPMRLVDKIGSPDLPPHNFAAVDIDMPGLGPIRVIGVVIRWKEKRAYLDALPEALAGTVNRRTIFAGDFNMSLLRETPLERDLGQILTDHDLRIVTKGPWPILEDERPLIDHIAVGSDLTSGDPHVWPRHISEDPRRITDHAGVALDLQQV